MVLLNIIAIQAFVVAIIRPVPVVVIVRDPHAERAFVKHVEVAAQIGVRPVQIRHELDRIAIRFAKDFGVGRPQCWTHEIVWVAVAVVGVC